MNLFTFQIEYKNEITYIYHNIISQLYNNSIILNNTQSFYENLVLYLYKSL
jgi:hypothetical protein